MNTKKLACLIFISALALILIAPMQSSAQAVDEPWPMFHQDPLHWGVGEGTAPTNLTPKWTVKLGATIIGGSAIAYGKVYVGCYDQNLYCLDAQTGNTVWKYLTNYQIKSTPAVTGGKVYIGPDDGNVYCLNADTGALIWKTTLSNLLTSEPESGPFYIRSSPTVVGDKIYVGHVDSYVYCLNADDGTQVWKYKTGGVVASSPSVYTGKVYIGAGDQNLHCINATDGKLIWKYDAGVSITSNRRQVVASPTIVPELNMVFFFANANAVHTALNMDTGELIWKYHNMRMRPYTWAQTTQAVTWATAVYSEATSSFYVIEDHFAQRIDAKTGATIWPLYGSPIDQTGAGTPTGVPTGQATGPGYYNTTGPNDLGFISCASPAYADGKVYYGSHRQTVYCFDAASTNAKRLSWYTCEGWVDGSPSIGYGNVYAGDTGWNFYCFTEGPARRMDPNDPTGTVPLLDPTTITGTLSATEVTVDDWIDISGQVNYQTGATIWEKALIFATFTRPDGSKWDANMMADWDGTFKISYRPDMEGTWTVKPRWKGDNYNAGIEGTPLTFTVVTETPPPAPTPPSAPTIISGIPDMYLYAGIAVIVIAILALVALLLRPKKKQ